MYVLPGAYHTPPWPALREASKTSIASVVQPILEPSATMRTPALTNASASSPDTSFWVAPGRAMWIVGIKVHGRFPKNESVTHTYISFSLAILQIMTYQDDKYIRVPGKTRRGNLQVT